MNNEKFYVIKYDKDWFLYQLLPSGSYFYAFKGHEMDPVKHVTDYPNAENIVFVQKIVYRSKELDFLEGSRWIEFRNSDIAYKGKSKEKMKEVLTRCLL